MIWGEEYQKELLAIIYCYSHQHGWTQWYAVFPSRICFFWNSPLWNWHEVKTCVTAITFDEGKGIDFREKNGKS